ncbi:DUF6560 family protein [Peribacillus aracenensis]|uniref:DUF6560 family protein n=1 Tax=Peribacillus aracenensis TaxID=2976708 RepID=UPI0021A9185C|nr:hypothetical protein [Peribacillus sp. BBB004]
MEFVLIGIIVMMMTYFVKRNKEKELLNNQNKDEFIVRLPKLYGWIGLICLILFLTLFIGMILYPDDTGDFWVGACFFGFVSLGGSLANASIAWKINVNINNGFFIYRTFFWRTIQIRYSDIQNVRSTQFFIILKYRNKNFFIDKTAYNVELFNSMLEKWKIEGQTTM